MLGLIHAEYLKLSRRRLYPVMLLILFSLVGLTGFFLLAFGQVAPDLAEGVPVLRKPAAYLVGVQQIASQTWFPLILAVVVLGGEMAGTTWATGLTRNPRKAAHLAARVLVLGVASWLAFLLATAEWALLAALVAPGSGGPAVGEWLAVVWKLGVLQLAWTSLGLGFVAMLRSVGPAIGAALALSFGEGILALWDPYEGLSLSAATAGLFQVDPGGMLGALIPGVGLSEGRSLVVVAGWALLGLLLTWWGMTRRDA